MRFLQTADWHLGRVLHGASLIEDQAHLLDQFVDLLAAGYQQTIGIDTRLERLDRAVAENERRILELTRRAEQCAARYDHRQLADCLKAAEKLQHHNSRLLKLIEHAENKLSAVAEKVAKETKEADKT